MNLIDSKFYWELEKDQLELELISLETRRWE